MPSKIHAYDSSTLNPDQNFASLRIIPAAILFFLFMLPASAWADNVPVPSVSIENVDTEPFIGEDNFSIDVAFDNSGNATGYGPYIDLIFPSRGADGKPELGDDSNSTYARDGIFFDSATYGIFDIPQSDIYELTFPVPDGWSEGDPIISCVEHPLARDANGDPIEVCGQSGDTLVVVRLPFGSFVPEQPPANITFQGNVSNLADLDHPLDFYARGGFQFGADPLDNPATDSSILSQADTDSTTWTPNQTVTPQIVTVEKTAEGGLTGPNYERQYNITVDIAPDQEIKDLVITDVLPSDVIYLGATPSQGSITDEPALNKVINPADNQLVVTLDDGASGTVILTIDYYVPEADFDFNPTVPRETAAGQTSDSNSVTITGEWADPIDQRDDSEEFTITVDDITREDIALLLGKSSEMVDGKDVLPGNIVRYSMTIDVSDYFAFEDLVIEDVLGDGHRWYTDENLFPTLSLSGHQGVLDAEEIDSGNYNVDPNYTNFGNEPLLNLPNPGNDGTTIITFDVSEELVRRGQSGQILGGGFFEDSIGDNNIADFNREGSEQTEDDNALNPTTITIVFYAEIQEYYGDPDPEACPCVVQGDSLDNTADLTAKVLQDWNLEPYGNQQTSSAGAGVNIDVGSLTKELYKINNEGPSGTTPNVRPGDEVTYRLTYELPTHNFEDLKMIDYLPLPIFDATTVTTFNATVSAAVPNVGEAKFGPSDTFYDFLKDNNLYLDEGGTRQIPLIQTSGKQDANSITFDYGGFETDDDPSDGPESIDILFTVVVSDDPFANGLFLTNQAQSLEENTAGDVSTMESLNQVILNEPDLEIDKVVTATSGEGTISDGNLTGADAGDTVTYQITLGNIGDHDAYDVAVTDPGATELESCTLDSVTVGGSNPGYSGDLFDENNPLVINGTISPEESAVITYNCTLSSDVTPRQEIDNTATAQWAAATGADKFEPISDDAQITIADPDISKDVKNISPGPADPNVVPGDIVTYELTVTLPEGTTTDLVIRDTLPDGFEFQSGTVTVNATGFGGTLGTGPTVSVEGQTSDGQTVTISFDSDTTVDSTADTLNNSFTITYDVQVLADTPDTPVSKQNTVVLNFEDNSNAASDDETVNFGAPDLTIAKSFSPSSDLQAGQEVTITLTVENTGTTPAFDIVVTDELNEGTNNDLLDLTTVSNTTPSEVMDYFSFDFTSPTVTYTSNSGVSLAADDSVTFTFTADVRDDVVTGSTFTNSASVSGDSQDGDVDEERDTEQEESADVTAQKSSVAKSIEDTSEDWTTGNNVAIGEVITYRLTYTIPQGVTRSDSPTILTDTLPAGQQYLTDTATIQGVYNTDLNGTVYDGSLPTSATSVDPTISDQKLQFDLGDLTNSDNDENDEQIIIEFDALVLNTEDNHRNQKKTNTAALNYLNNAETGQTQTATQDVTIVEPNLAVTKTADPTTADGGDSITFEVVVSNESGTDVSRAWEVTLEDVLPARYQSPTLTNATLSRGSTVIDSCADFNDNTLNLNMNCLDAGNRYLAPGDSITLVYTATLDPEVAFEETVDNTAQAQATSLPGNKGTDDAAPGDPDSDTGERTGSGDTNTSGQSVNDLTAQDSATVTANRPSITKNVADDSLQIGDTTNATLTIAVPVGQTENFNATDVLPTGLAYTGEEITITLPDSNFSASKSPATTPGAGTNPLVFDFGTVQNSGTTSQNIVIQYQVQVKNILANQRNTDLTNTATLTYDGAVEPNPSASATIAVREPKLELVKTITEGTPATAGSEVTYQLEVKNTDSHASAYRLELKDVLPSELLGANDGTGPFFTSIEVTNPDNNVVKSDGGDLLTASDASFNSTNETDDTLTWPLFNLPPSTTLTITYTAQVIDTAVTGATLTNEVEAEYNSLADGSGRDGSNVLDDTDNDQLDNYGQTTNRDLVLDSNITLQKTLTTGQSDSNFAIGEEVQFDLKVSLLTGVTESVVVTDTLPNGLAFVELETIEASSNISYTGSGTAVEDPTGTVTVDMGDVTNDPDDDPENDFFILRLKTRVKNIPANQNSDVLTNSAEVTSAIGDSSDTRDITVVEPVLAVEKVPSTTVPALGDEITYEIEVRHDNGSAADAYNVVLTDLIPIGLEYVSGSATGPVDVDETNSSQPVFDLGTVTQADSSKTFSYRAKVLLDAVVGTSLTNTIIGTFSSTSDATGEEDSGRTGPLNDADTPNDYVFFGSASVTPSTNAFIYPVKTVSLVADVDNSGQVDPGDTLEYSIEVKNSGPDATGVVFTDPIPTNTTYVSGSLNSTQGTTDDSGDPLMVTIGDLGSGAMVTISFRVTVNDNVPAGTIISNQGLVDSDLTVPTPTDADGVPENGFQPTDVPVGGQPALENALYAEKGVFFWEDENENGIVNPGDTLLYYILLSNRGDQNLTNISLTDTIPDGLSYVNSSAWVDKGTTDFTTSPDFIWNVNELEPGGLATLLFEVIIDDPLPEDLDSYTFINQGSTNSDQTDPGLTDGNGDPSDGFQQTTIDATTGGGQPALDVQKRWHLAQDFNGNGLANPGDEIGYQIRITNNGSAASQNTRLDDVIPANTNLIPGSVNTDTGAVVGTDPIAINLGSLTPGGVAIVSFRVQINSGTPDGTIIDNQAFVDGDNFDEVPSDDNGNPADGLNPTLTPVFNPEDPEGPGPIPAQPGNLGKSVFDTSEPDSEANSVLIGEVATFRVSVDVPPGTLREARIEDVLPAGVGYVNGTARLSRTFATGLSASQNPGDINSELSGDFVDLDDGTELEQENQTLSLFLGDVINSDTGAAAYTLEYQAVVKNVGGNQDGTSLSNSATLRYLTALNQPASLSPVNTTLNVIEPDISISKSVDPMIILPSGGTVTYTVILSNAAGAAPAYDAVIDDPIPTDWDLTNVSVQYTGGASGADNSDLDADTLLVNVTLLPANASVTVTYTVDAPDDLSDGQSIPNTATGNWTSLPGNKGTGDATPGDPGTGDGERTDSGTVPNDYTDSDDARVLVGQPALSKTILEKQDRYAIGDQVRYELRLSVPADAVLEDAVLSDFLVNGLTYVSGSLEIEYDDLNAVNSPSDFTVGSNGDDSTLTADFDTLSNTGSETRTLVATYKALVANQLSNQNGQSLANTAGFAFTDPGTGDPATPLSADESITVGEPVLALNKDITSTTADLDAGDTVDFEVTVGNSGTTTAYDVTLEDQLPVGLQDISGLTVVEDQSDVQPTLTANGASWSSSAFDLPVDDVLVIRFTATLADTVIPGDTLQNTVTSTFSSRPGDDPDQRDGSGDAEQSDYTELNNYNKSGLSPTITVDDPVALDKRFHTDQTKTTYTIGEIVTYRLRVDLIEGTINDLVVVDTLPDGVSFISADVGLGHLGMTTGNSIATDDQPSGIDGQELTFNLGTVVNPANEAADDDFLTIDIQARVDNIQANQDGVVLGNNSYLTFTRPEGTERRDFDADAEEDGIQSLDLTIVEPELDLSKTTNLEEISLGDEVTFTLTIDHSVNSTANAFNLVVEDTLPPGLSYVEGSANPAPTSIDGQTLRWELASLTLDQDNTSIGYRAQVETTATVGQELKNDAALSYSSLPGANGGIDSGRTGEDGPDGELNDYAHTAEAGITPTTDAFLYPVKTVAHVVDADNTGVVNPEDTLEYTIELSNQGAQTATGVVFTDPIPANTSYVANSLTSTQGNINDSGDPLVVEIGELESGGSVTITFRVQVDTPTPPGVIISNQGMVDSDQTVPTPSDADGAPENGFQPTEIPVGGSPGDEPLSIRFTKDFALTGDDVPPVGTINDGDQVTYTLVISNTGQKSLTSVKFEDEVPTGPEPPGMDVSSITTSQGTAPTPSNSITIDDIGDIDAGESVIITVTGTVNGAGEVENQAKVMTDQLGETFSDGDGNPANGAQPTIFPVLQVGSMGEPSLELDKRIELIDDANSDNQVNPGELVRFVLVTRNVGAAPASNVGLTDDFSEMSGDLVENSVLTTQGIVVSETPVEVNFGDLAPGASATVTFSVRAGDPGELKNNARVEDEDENTASDSASAQVVIFTPFDPPSGCKVVNDSGLPELEWTMVWLNPNQTYISPIVVIDQIPENSEFVPGSLECITNGSSTQISCRFDEADNQVIFEGFIGPDPGATGLDDSNNAIVISFRVEVQNMYRQVSNQGFAFWDQNGDGSLDPEQTPQPTDDCDTDETDDVTTWYPPAPKPVPGLSDWGLFVYPLLLAMIGIWYLRRQRRMG